MLPPGIGGLSRGRGLRGARPECARKRLGPPWCAIGERERGAEPRVVRVHAQVTYLGVTSAIGVCAMAFSLLLRGGRVRALKVKGRTGETYPAHSLTLSCTRGLGAVRGPSAHLTWREGISLQERSRDSLAVL